MCLYVYSFQQLEHRVFLRLILKSPELSYVFKSIPSNNRYFVCFHGHFFQTIEVCFTSISSNNWKKHRVFLRLF